MHTYSVYSEELDICLSKLWPLCCSPDLSRQEFEVWLNHQEELGKTWLYFNQG